nr:AHH domain-containing protein [Pseudomonas sp. NFR16]
MPGIAGFQKHHIIPQQFADHAVLKSAGMNIHASNNIIYITKICRKPSDSNCS